MDMYCVKIKETSYVQNTLIWISICICFI